MNTTWLLSKEKPVDPALAEREQRYHRLLAATSDYAYSVVLRNGLAGSTTHGQGCEAVTGYTPAEFANDPYLWFDIIYPQDRPLILNQINRIASNELPAPVEHRIRHKSGSLRWVRNTPILHRDGEGRILSYDGLISDITERKQAEERLQAANAKLIERGAVLQKLVRHLHASHRELRKTQLQLIQAAKLESLGTLAAGVAHEIQNPLQTILLGLHYLGKCLTAPDENLSLTLRDMREAVQRANNIVRELLALSANTDFHWVREDLNGVLERSLLLSKSALAKSHITVKLEFSPDLPRLRIDPAKLEQVFINVFVNSIQAMPAGGTLTVRTRRLPRNDRLPGESGLDPFQPDETLVVAEVQDTGPGLTEAALAKAFDAFFTTKPVGVGTGLGLSVARKIVEVHGGNIEIKNAPGGGALVVITLNA